MNIRPFLGAILIGLLSLSSATFAADAERVDRYLELSRIESMMGQMTQLMQASAEQGLMQAAQQEGLSPEKLAQARELLFTQLAGMAEALSWEAMQPEFAALISDSFSDAELDAANAFLASPAGQSMLDKQPELMRRSAEIGQRRMMEVMPAVQAEVKRIIVEMAGE
jgi:uncharacterized protein